MQFLLFLFFHSCLPSISLPKAQSNTRIMIDKAFVYHVICSLAFGAHRSTVEQHRLHIILAIGDKLYCEITKFQNVTFLLPDEMVRSVSNGCHNVKTSSVIQEDFQFLILKEKRKQAWICILNFEFKFSCSLLLHLSLKEIDIMFVFDIQSRSRQG